MCAAPEPLDSSLVLGLSGRATSTCVNSATKAGPTVAKSNTLLIGTEANIGRLIALSVFHAHHCMLWAELIEDLVEAVVDGSHAHRTDDRSSVAEDTEAPHDFVGQHHHGRIQGDDVER